MGTLLKLPNELAFQIFDDLDDAALLTLAKSCQHLNIIVTSYYLSRHHMPDPSYEIDLCLEKDFDVLPFLRVSTLLASSQDIHTSFTTSGYLGEIRGLESLVDKLSSVKVVVLSLFFIHEFGNQEDELHFAMAIRDLLTTIIARSCETLCIGYGPSFTLSHHTSEQKSQRIGLSRLSRRFIAPFRKILRNSATENTSHILSLDTFPSSKLRILRIYSGTLFDRLFLQWTIHLINTSPITSLSIGNLLPMPFPWDDLLSSIRCPTLSEICIEDGSDRLRRSSLAAFLAVHQTITSLECQRLSSYGLNDPNLFLPQLARLVSSYDSITLLLDDVTAFPSLREVTLRFQSYSSFDPSIVKNALACVNRCPNELELSLKFPLEDEAFIAWLDVDINDRSRVERSLYRVICLKLIIGKFSTKTLLVLPKWLALFPALHRLTFQSGLHNQTVPYSFALSIIHSCSQLETLTINEETHIVATWLAMEDFH